MKLGRYLAATSLMACSLVACDKKKDDSATTSDDCAGSTAQVTLRLLEDGTATSDATTCPSVKSGQQTTDSAGTTTTPSVDTTTDPQKPPAAFTLDGPSGVTSDTTPEITWAKSSGASDYTASISTHADCSAPVATINKIVTTAASPATPLDDGSYYSCVTAHNAAGSVSATNNGMSFTVDSTAPQDLKTFTATSPAIGTANVLAVFADDRSDYYELHLHYATGATPPVDCASGIDLGAFSGFLASGVNFVVSGATPGVTLSFRACIYDMAGNVSSAKTVSIVTKATHTIFATYATYDGNLKSQGGTTYASGLAGADARCNQAADDAMLSGNWKAVISDSSTSAFSRLQIAAAVYNTNSPADQIATDASDFWDNAALPAAILYDEDGDPVAPTNIWTATNGSGAISGQSCNDWQTNDSGSTGAYGLANQTFTWISAGNNTCDKTYHIYCVDQLQP